MIQPKVAIVMPNYNKGRYIKQAVDSALSQKYNNYEVVIVDNCSTDDSIEILKTYKDDRIRLIFHDENKDVVYSMNEGIGATDAELIMLLCSDDLIADTAVLNLTHTLLSEPNIGIAYSPFLTSRNTIASSREWDLDYLMRKNYLPITTLFTKQAWRDVGGFDPSFKLAEDWEMWIAIGQAGYIGKRWGKPESLYRMDTDGSGLNRLLDNSMGMENSEFYKLCVQLYRKYQFYYDSQGLTPEQLYYYEFPRGPQDYI